MNSDTFYCKIETRVFGTWIWPRNILYPALGGNEAIKTSSCAIGRKSSDHNCQRPIAVRYALDTYSGVV
jgi:hypothetical protein